MTCQSDESWSTKPHMWKCRMTVIGDRRQMSFSETHQPNEQSKQHIMRSRHFTWTSSCCTTWTFKKITMLIIIIIIIFFIMVKTYSSTLQALQQQPVTQTAMIDLSLYCHAGQQQQPGLARGSMQPNTNGAKLLTIRSGRPGLYLVSFYQMAPPERRAHIW